MENDIQSIVKISERMDNGFSKLKFFTVCAFVFAAIALAFAVIYPDYTISKYRKQIYVMDTKGQIYTADQANSAVTRKVEVQDQLIRFHEMFFNVSPNPDAQRYNLERALEISDKSVLDYYNDLNEQGFYKRLSSTNSSQQVKVDSVFVDMSKLPYRAITYCTRWVTRESNMTMYSLVTTCNVLEVNRSQNDPHGLKLEKFSVVESEERQTLRR